MLTSALCLLLMGYILILTSHLYTHHIYINYDAPIHPPYIYINYDAALKHFLSKFYSEYACLKLLISTSNKNITYILIICNSDDLFG